MNKPVALIGGLVLAFILIGTYKGVSAAWEWVTEDEPPPYANMELRSSDAPPAVVQPNQPTSSEWSSITDRFQSDLGCGKVTKAMPEIGMPGRLWSCVLGTAETAKLFVNEKPGGGIQNIKAMWNDWTREGGFGLHADKAEFHRILLAVSRVYPSLELSEMVALAEGDRAATLRSGSGVTSTYTMTAGPKIDERLFVIMP